MDKYTNVARRKIAELIRREDFKSITSISDFSVFIEFDSSACQVSNFGQVTWLD